MFDFEKLKEPGYYRENRLDAHSDHCFYASEAERDAPALGTPPAVRRSFLSVLPSKRTFPVSAADPD